MGFEKVCPQCGIRFTSEKRKAIYCCLKCSQLAKRREVEVLCNFCGKKFFKKKSNLANMNYCSNDCKGSYRKSNEYILNDNYAEMIIINRKGIEFKVLIDLDSVDLCKNFTWFAMRDKKYEKFYIYASNNKNVNYHSNSTSIKLHRLITNCPENMQVDHINRNTLDNRKCNLRICTNFENAQNRSVKSNSGHIGVLKIRDGKWVSRIRIKNDKLNRKCS